MKANYKLATTVAEIKEYLTGAKEVAFDFETAGMGEYSKEEFSALDPHKADIVGISMSKEVDTAIYIPLRHKNYKNADVVAVMEYLKTNLFENESIMKIAHNMAFEAMFLYKEGIILQEPLYDTIVASQLTLKNYTEFRGLGDSGLKKLVPELYGDELPKFEDVVQGRNFDELNPEDWETLRYASADSDYTLMLFHTFNEWFEEYMPKHRFICEKIESPVAVFTGMMKYNGIGVDRELMKEKLSEAEEQLKILKDKILFVTGDIDIGENCSTQSFKDYLYKDLQLPKLKVTAKYQAAADDETLQRLIAFCKTNKQEIVPLLETVQEYRKLSKIKSTYIDGYANEINSVTGKIHTNFFPMGTQTGRFASRKPNMQNMPRKTNDPVGVRNFFISSEHNTFLDFDFSQIELRVGAFYCRDPKMMETYKNNGDIHAQTTAVIFGGTPEEAADKNTPNFKEHRTIAKNCNFGVFFGLFPKGLQTTLKFKGGVDKSIEECDVIIRNLKQGYASLADWQKETIWKAKRDRYSETYLGRRRMLPKINSMDWGMKSYSERCALNTPIQGTAADILKLSMCRLLKYLKNRQYIKPVLQIHDELLFEVTNDKIDEATIIIKKAMEHEPFKEFDLPIIAEGELGTVFGKLEEIR